MIQFRAALTGQFHLLPPLQQLTAIAVVILLGLALLPPVILAEDDPATDPADPPAPAAPDEAEETPPGDLIGDLAVKLTEAQRIVERLESTPPHQWSEQLGRAWQLVNEVLEQAPQTEAARALKDQIAALQIQKQAEYRRLVEEATWPKHIEEFKGPRFELADEALRYLKEDNPQWQERGPIAVAIRGQWQAHDQLGDDAIVVQWALPVYVAAPLADNPEMTRVYPLLLLTERKESRFDARKEPPFTAAIAKGETYDMLTERVEMQTPDERGLLWLLLMLANLAGGFLLLGPWLRGGVPVLGGLAAALEPAQAGIGVFVLLIGAMRLVGAVIMLSGANILPILGAVVAGAVLSREILPKGFSRALVKPLRADDGEGLRGALTTAEKTTHDLPDAERQAAELADESVTGEVEEDVTIVRGEGNFIRNLLEMLAVHQVRLGAICTFLGLVHLLVPGAWLF